MILNKINLMSFIAILLFSCQSNDPNHIEQEKRHDEVMVVHDEVMPRMGEIHKLGKELKKVVKNNSVENDSILNEIKNTIKYLESADDGMMDWMHEYSRPSKLRKDKTHEEILAYLDEEMKKVEKVKYDINTSIENAQKLLATQKNKD